MTLRHFLRDDDLAPDELLEVLDLAVEMKADRHRYRPLAGPRAVALIFDKPTLRTQLSFSVGVAELGGQPDRRRRPAGRHRRARVDRRHHPRDHPAGRGDRLAHLRPGPHRGDGRAQHACPVVNALTDSFHPCQVLADLLTVREHRGALAGQTLTYVGDGANNMAHSYLLGGAAAGLHVRIAGPAGLRARPGDRRRRARHRRRHRRVRHRHRRPGRRASTAPTSSPPTRGCRWGRRTSASAREAPFRPYAVDRRARWPGAKDDAIVLHCLPAYRGKEIAADVLDGPQSVVWDEAENRLHAQKALLTFLLERS